MKTCPKCGCTKFSVTPHVTQDWLVDGNGNFISCTNQCVEVTHKPDDEDIWTCMKCGFSDSGSKFNITSEK